MVAKNLPAAIVNDFTERSPDNLPETLEDTIQVTKALGYQYLWIDRYFIDRRDTQRFAAQLQQTAMVYRNSSSTIVATSGGNGPSRSASSEEKASTICTSR